LWRLVPAATALTSTRRNGSFAAVSNFFKGTVSVPDVHLVLFCDVHVAVAYAAV